MRTPTLFMFALSLAACGRGGEAPNAMANAAEPAGNQVAALSDGQRNAVFIRAIRDARLDCQHVERSEPAGDYRGMPVWRATCRGGAEWTIVIGADGTAQILSAAEAASVTPPIGNGAVPAR